MLDVKLFFYVPFIFTGIKGGTILVTSFLLIKRVVHIFAAYFLRTTSYNFLKRCGPVSMFMEYFLIPAKFILLKKIVIPQNETTDNFSTTLFETKI